MLDPRQVPRRHRQLAQPETQKERRIARVTRHLAADADRNASARGRLDGELDEAQHTGMQRVVEVGDLFVAAVDRQGVLDQIVGADGEEIGFARQCIGGQRRRRHLDHHPQRRDDLGKGDAAPAQAPRHLLDDSRVRRISPTDEIIGSMMRTALRAPSRIAASWCRTAAAPER